MCTVYMQAVGVPISVLTAANLIAGVYDKFNLDGAYLLKTPEQKNNEWLNKVGRRLIRRSIPTSIFNFNRIVDIEIDVQSFPICVMNYQEEDNISALQQASGGPWG
ncbi:hypothetical protein L9F63_012139, partial [Diploptera punctata]